MAATTPHDQPALRTYLTGFALALILTFISFGLVASDLLAKTPTLLVVASAAVVQVLVHLHYFLHLGRSTAPRRNIVAIAFATILIFIMVGGSLWIMFDLYNRMMV